MAHQPFNLKNALLWAAIALGGFTFQACSSDDDYPTVDGQNPTISLTSDLIHAEPGRTFNITGKISDADGIFTLFMGDEVEPRRRYIEEHAKDVKHLDV